MRKAFQYTALFCLFASVGAVWWPLGNLGVWLKIGLSILAPLVFVGVLLVTEFVLIAVGLEGRSFHGAGLREPVRRLVGCAAFLAVLLVAVISGRRWWPVGQHNVPAAEVELTGDSNAGAKAKLTGMLHLWQDKVGKILKAKKQFEEEKGDLISRMTKMGFRSSTDISKSKAHQKVAEELLELQTQIKILYTQQTKYQSAIAQTQSAVRRISRQERLEEVGVSSEEFNKLAQTAVELDERLQSGSDQSLAVKIELDSLLNETFDEGAAKETKKGEQSR